MTNNQNLNNEEEKKREKIRNSVLGSSLFIIAEMREDSDIENIIQDMHEKFDLLQEHGSRSIEEMLLYQVYALQAIFEKAATNLRIYQYTDAHQSWAAVALKAQNQIRQTLATLADIRNPRRVSFITQQANAMQINFQTENHKNELSQSTTGVIHGQQTTMPINLNPQMEAVAEINRPANTRREKKKQIKFI